MPSLGGALQLIGVRAVFLDARNFVADGKRVEDATRRIAEATAQLSASSTIGAVGQNRLAAANAKLAASSQLTAVESVRLAQARDKLTVASNATAAATQRLATARAALRVQQTGRNPNGTFATGVSDQAKAAALKEEAAARRAVTTATNAEDRAQTSLNNKLQIQRAVIQQRVAGARTDLVSTQAAQAAAQLEKQAAATKKLQDSEKALAIAQKERLVIAGKLGAIAAVAVAVGITAAAVKTAATYQDTLTKIDNLTNLTSEETKRLGETILQMSRHIPKSPEELGAAAYVILSSGINDVDEALRILKDSAEAAVAGFGDTKEIAIAVTGIINAYGKENISAAQATDILFAAVKEGRAEISDFAGNIGRAVPFAKLLGITFDQLAAAVASLTDAGLPARQAVTAILDIENQLISPSQQAKDALLGMGTSIEKLRQEVREKGLIVALQDLLAKNRNNQQVIDALIPSIRGEAGALDLLSRGAADYNSHLDKITNSSGIVDQAFKNTEKNFNVNAQLLKNQLNVALIRLGSAILPALVKIMSDVVTLFQNSSNAIDKASTSLGGNLIPALGILGNALLGPISQLTSILSLLARLSGATIDIKTKTFGHLGAGPFGKKGITLPVDIDISLPSADDVKDKFNDIDDAAKKLANNNLPQIPAEFNDFDIGAGKAKETIDVLKDHIIDFEEATKLGWDAATSGAVEAVDYMAQYTNDAFDQTKEEAFNFQKTLTKVAYAFNQSHLAGQRLVLTLGREALAKTQSALSAVLGGTTREGAQLNLALAKFNLGKLNLEFLIKPQLDALSDQMKAIKDMSDVQLTAIDDQIKSIQDASDARKTVLERQLKNLDRKDVETPFENQLKALDKQSDTLNDNTDATKKSLQATLDSVNDMEVHTKAEKDYQEAQKKKAEQAIKDFDAQSDSQKKNLDKQKDSVKEQLDAAKKNKDDQKQAIQDQIDAIDEQTKNQINALQNQSDALKRNTEAQVNATQKQSDALQKQIDDYSKQGDAIQHTIDLYAANADILKAQSDVANVALLTDSERQKKSMELIGNIATESQIVRDLANATGQDLIPEVNDATAAFTLMNQASLALNNEGFRNSLIPSIDAVALRNWALAQAAGDAAANLGNLARTNTRPPVTGLLGPPSFNPLFSDPDFGSYASGGFINRPQFSMLGEGSKPELVLPLSNETRSRQLLASIPPSLMARINPGSGGDTNINLYNPSFPNITNGREFLSEMQSMQTVKLRDSRRGIARG